MRTMRDRPTKSLSRKKMLPSNKRKHDFNLIGLVPAHLPELADLWVAAWTKAMPAIDFEMRRGWFVDHLVAMRDRGALVCCAFNPENGEMAGFVTLEPATGLVDQLAVSPALWGSAVARELLDWARQNSQGALELDVNQDNARAVRFYEREGFERVSEGVNPNSGLRTWHYCWRAT